MPTALASHSCISCAVGSVAGQIAKRAGARVVGIAGGSEKCLYVQDTLGFDACIDHRALHLDRELKDACPNGIDGYFENVGGAVQAAVFGQLNRLSRVAMCGMVSQYNDKAFPPGPNLGFVVGKAVRIQGFIVSDRPARFTEWRAMAEPLVAGNRRSLVGAAAGDAAAMRIKVHASKAHSRRGDFNMSG